jgi:hypothetical protein
VCSPTPIAPQADPDRRGTAQDRDPGQAAGQGQRSGRCRCRGTSDPLKSIADDISAAFGDLISSNQMTVRGNELWVEIELNSSLLFGSGDAMPSDIAFNIIDKVAAILKPFDNPIHVEGFHRRSTDPHRAVPDQLGAVFGAFGEHRAHAGDAGVNPASGVGGVWRVPAGGQ